MTANRSLHIISRGVCEFRSKTRGADLVHAVVLIKQVPDTTEVRIDPKTNTMIRAGVPSILNPYDANAVEEAVRWRERLGGKVTVITMGPPQAKEALRKCLSFGADRAILLTDRAFAGADTLATSYALATTIQKIMETEPVDLVFCGRQAIDGDTGQVGPGVARRLGFEQLTYVIKVDEIDPEKGEIQVRRVVEDGIEVVRTKLPALLTVEKEINEVRYATMPDLLRAARQEIEVWTKDTIGADPNQCGLKGSPTVVSKSFVPSPPDRHLQLFEGDVAAQAAALAEKLSHLDVFAGRLG